MDLWATSNGFPGYLGQQIYRWIWQKTCSDPGKFTNIKDSIKKILTKEFEWSVPHVDTRLTSADGSEKFLLRLFDGQWIEMVLMPSETRTTLCISSQVGCRMGCTFCQTGRMGLKRNLRAGEIMSQVFLANRHLQAQGFHRRITNIVFMGMGEPLDNFDAVVQSCQMLICPAGLGISRHRVTVSTSGLVPEIEKLGKAAPVSLAISLHSADDAQRSSMMPVNKHWPLSVLKEALLKYPIQTRHGITFEYVMIAGKNDSLSHAKKLVKFLHGLKAKVNLIPMNAHPGSPMTASDENACRNFQMYLSRRSIPAPVRYSRGQDVSAACGQLVMKRQGEEQLAPRQVVRARWQEFKQSVSCESLE